MEKKRTVLFILIVIVVAFAAAGGGILMINADMGKTAGMEPRLVTLDESMVAVGLATRTNMKGVFRDLPKVYRKYLDLKAQYGIPDLKEPWEYVSLSDSFEADKYWVYHTGHVVTRSDRMPAVFTSFTVPTGKYAVFPLRPRHQILLGLAMGKIKRYIYTQWLPGSPYEFSGYEYEYSSEEISGKNPSFLDLYVGIKDKE